MARDGTSTILEASRKICKMVATFGVVRFAQRTTPEFGAAVSALVAACNAFEALDDFPGEIDQTIPIRPGEDVFVPPPGA